MNDSILCIKIVINVISKINWVSFELFFKLLKKSHALVIACCLCAQKSDLNCFYMITNHSKKKFLLKIILYSNQYTYQ